MSWPNRPILRSNGPVTGILFLFLLIATSAFAGTAHAKAKSFTLDPASGWVVKWSQTSCILARKFGTGSKPFLLSLKAYAPGYQFEVTLAGAQTWGYRKGGLLVAYGDSEPQAIGPPQNGHMNTYGPAVIFTSTLPNWKAYPDTEFENGLQRIAISTVRRKLILNTGPMAKALSALRQCTDNLIVLRGFDPEVQNALSRRIKPIDPSRWIDPIQKEFPPELFAMARNATVHILVRVDEKGMPTRCDTVQTFDNTDFDVRACGIILDKARFHPALDRNGQPVASYYANFIAYHQK
ncbi:energy transducer TonB [Novosphingobium beihaiensis]|uniref:Energy transducer TonB n=1 Tax=Novosphingobium beihaiensis TaxID=2930389 RepID=A0ABT0BQV3_9SPHN|nr:energy transducer TonB [Novosphingobium beihaiensis]MCJ2187421.1 energy transducer TonB [Novosphingobium beihaiensis]